MAHKELDSYEKADTPESAKVLSMETQDKDDENLEFSFISLYRYANTWDRLMIGVGILMAIVNGGALPFMAILFGDAINNFSTQDQSAINQTALNFFILALVLLVSGYASYACFEISGERQMKALRREVLKHIMYQEMKWYDEQDGNQLASRISGDTVKIKEGLGEKLGEAFRFLFQFLVGYGIGFYKGWNLALAMCAMMPILAMSLTYLVKRLGESTTRSQQAYADAGAVAEETIGAIRTVASLNQETKAIRRFDERIKEAEFAALAMAKVMSFSNGWIALSMWLPYTIGLWYGGYLVKEQNEAVNSPGSVFAAFYGILMGTTSLAQISPNIAAVVSAKGAAFALFNILARASKIDASKLDGEIPASCDGKIEIKDVCFAYPTRPDAIVLSSFSLTIDRGQTVALVGSSGSGKSTLVALLERFYEPISGDILLDGRSVSKLQIKWLRSQIGLVSQEPILFATTIFENIAAGSPEVSKEQVVAAAKLANAHNFIMQLPDQYNTMCGENGTTLSGGQKQRLAIARALVRKPKILVLDEATSALDHESERVVQASLYDLMSKTNMTTIIIAHRLSTIRNADKIIVLSQGTVVESGSHSQLLKISGGLYKKMVELQEQPPLDFSASENVDSIPSNFAQDEATDALVRKHSSTSLETSYCKASPSTSNEVDSKTVSVAQIMELTRPQRPYLIAGFIACVFQGFSMPIVALIIANVMATMQKNYNLYLTTNKRQYLDTLYSDAREQSCIFLGIAVVIFFVSYVQTYTFRLIGEKLTTRLRNMHFQAIVRQDIGFFDQDGNTTGALTTDLSTNATKVVAIAGENQSRIVQTIFTLVGAVIISFSVGSWQLTLIMLCVIPLVIGATMYRSRRMKGQNTSDSLKLSGSLAAEAIANIRTVSAFGLQELLVDKYDNLLTQPMQEGIRRAHINGIVNGVATFSTFAVYALVFWYGNKLIQDKAIDFQEMIRTLMTVLMAAQGMGQTAAWIGDSDAAKKSAQEIFSIVNRKPIIDSSQFNEGVIPATMQGRIVFRDVDFHYPTRPDISVLKNCNLTIEAGQTVALCGPSGGGKSTAIALLERFYQQQNGTITLDGHEISTLNLQWLRNRIGYVGQEPVLFVGSIAENISCGITTTEDIEDLQHAIEKAAKMANAHNFIMQFPDGYQTQVGSKGAQLSGGQKQRIAIARAIIKNPSILLLDEATSALDSESEKAVQKALDKLLAEKGRTTLLIAHRLSTIRSADKICVVSHGRIAEEGTHEELVQKNGVYKRLLSIHQND